MWGVGGLVVFLSGVGVRSITGVMSYAYDV
jgi:hypothetical protein